MDPRRWIRNFFGFTRNQTNGFIFLLPLIGIFIFSEPIKRWYQSSKPRDFTHERIKLDSLAALWNREEINIMPEEKDVVVTYFHFNPNIVSEDQLLALGFSKGLAKRLINYRNKGGEFKVRNDLLKLYGMDSAFHSSLYPFILLPEKIQLPGRAPMPGIEYGKKEPVRFDLNQADTILLKSVYGIGPKLSARIIVYRESLGGFISTDQVYEVYGLDSAVVDRLLKVSFIQEDFFPKTLNLNTAGENELDVHPYISKRMAKAIVTYRFQHGRFQSVDDLRNILQMEETQLNRIRPYLTVD